MAIRHLLARRSVAIAILVAALLLKLLVPAGYMIAADHGRVTITLCPGTMPAAPAPAAMHGMHGKHEAAADRGHADHRKDGRAAEQPCAFAGLSAAATGAIDPVLLSGLIAFVIAIGLGRAVLPAPSAPPRLRPPLRGPPLPA